MVKQTLHGSTTRAIGKQIAGWIATASVWVIARCNGQDVGLIAVEGLTAVLDGGIRVALSSLRIHRLTIQQIRDMIGV